MLIQKLDTVCKYYSKWESRDWYWQQTHFPAHVGSAGLYFFFFIKHLPKVTSNLIIMPLNSGTLRNETNHARLKFRLTCDASLFMQCEDQGSHFLANDVYYTEKHETKKKKKLKWVVLSSIRALRDTRCAPP